MCCISVVNKKLPYIRTGADIVLETKWHDERNGLIFPKSTSAVKVIEFGNSRVMAGLKSKYFDDLAKIDGIETYTYNGGLPAREGFIAELKTIVASGNPPNVILLTEPWATVKPRSIFSLPISDHDLADIVFPFHLLVRDVASFLVTSHARGGIQAFYKLGAFNQEQMRKDQGYYFISEQSSYPSGRLPDNFHYPEDTPNTPILRTADPSSLEIAQLNQILHEHPIVCLYVPYPEREGAAAPLPSDENFRQILENDTSCKLIGPNYLLYPNKYFSDRIHLNPSGAQAYTKDLYSLVHPYLTQKEHRNAIQ